MKNLFTYLFAIFVFASCATDKKEVKTSEADYKSENHSAAKSGHPTKVYFGDTHLHTDLSMDAGAFGNRIGMDEAYKFARGEEVTSTAGQKTRLDVPLDFIVIADHSDGMAFSQDYYLGMKY